MGELAGITGTMEINNEEGRHSYVLYYEQAGIGIKVDGTASSIRRTQRDTIGTGRSSNAD